MDDMATDEELRQWVDEGRASVERYRRLRRRYLQAHAEERRQLLREWALASLTELDALARTARSNLASHERALEARRGDDGRS